MEFLTKIQRLMDATRKADFLGPLALRLYLVPVFWVAGTNKVKGFGNVMNWFGNPDWGPVLAFYIGLTCLGALFNAIGVLASALTRNQLIAAIISLGTNLFLFFLHHCRGVFPEDPEAQRFFDFISFHHHFFNDYSKGLMDIRYLILYLGFAFFILFFAVKVVESRRWR